MMTEERTRFELLLENLHTSVQTCVVKMIAADQRSLTKRLDRMEDRFDTLKTEFYKLESRFYRLENTVNKLESKFNELAGDTQQRFERIETQLQLNSSSSSPPRQKATSDDSPKHRKKS
jgi:predicted nuclease with TOPRIM domain